MNRGDSGYIAWRIIDCCLREDLRGIMHRGSEAAPAPAAQNEPPLRTSRTGRARSETW